MGLVRSGYKYLFLLNGRYYFWMRIPKDLRSRFPSPWLKRSPTTDNLKNAKTLVNSHISKVRTTFTLFRSGVLSDEQALSAVASILPIQPLREDTPKLLSCIFRLDFTEHSPNWTAKTAQEFERQFAVMLSILKDLRIDSYTHQACLLCRSVLLEVHTGIYGRRYLPDEGGYDKDWCLSS